MQRYDIIGQDNGQNGGGSRVFSRPAGGASRSFVRNGGARSFVRNGRSFSRPLHRGFHRFPRRVVDVSFAVSPWWNWWGGGWPWPWSWGYVQPWYAYPGYQQFQVAPRWQDENVRRAYAEWRQAEAAGAEPGVVAQLKARFEALLFA